MKFFLSFIMEYIHISLFYLKYLPSKIDKFEIKIYFRIIFIFIGISYILLLNRLVLYGIPLELIEIKNIIISSESFFFREVIGFLLLVFLILYALFTTINGLIIKKNIFSMYGIYFLFFIIIIPFQGLFSLELSDNIFDILIFISCLIFIVHMLLNFEKNKIYIKYALIGVTTILFFSITMESIYQIRYKTSNSNKHFHNNNIFSEILDSYILEYKKPYIEEVHIDKKSKNEIVFVLGNVNGYIYYYPREQIIDILNSEISHEIKEKICVEKDKTQIDENIYYPRRTISLLKTSSLRSRKFERKKEDRIKLITEFVNFRDSFCENLTVDE
ncbi:MAG: hypothetical protein C0626_01740 [Arcobacter sp.]|uniref:hypothetical protein n=1 Tax=uncultured Arcobacter sp. TaxID=165434 RepID=UPI000CAB4437|nr:hypothetical protein [uncultured Arcobacter sp.]PLY11316.1 MAG: hypothetical protein C0626_01740 [Arcobacter sp.]